MNDATGERFDYIVNNNDRWRSKSTTLKKILSILLQIITIVLMSILFYKINYIYLNVSNFVDRRQNQTSSKQLQECFISLTNFVTIRPKNYTNYEFQLETFAHSYTSPYLIQLIQNSKNDCLCCG